MDTADRTPSNAPFLYTRGRALVLVDSADDSWEVRDYMRISGRVMRLLHRSAAAEYRVFIPAEGAWRLHVFFADEPRDLTPTELVRQLELAVSINSVSDEQIAHRPELLTRLFFLADGEARGESRVE